MERVAVSPDTTLQSILEQISGNKEETAVTVVYKSIKIKDQQLCQPIAELGITHGALLSLQDSNPDQKKNAQVAAKEYISLKEKASAQRWDPFPDLAKDLTLAVTRAKKRRALARSNSYGDLSNIQSEFHVVEPQPKGPIERVYMCHKAAADLQSHTLQKKAGSVQNRVALLLGTIQRERLNANQPKRAKTSLSSTTKDEEYCQVVKVHAIWEPSSQTGGTIDLSLSHNYYDRHAVLSSNNQQQYERVCRVASSIGLVPVGWMYTHNDDRHSKEGEDSLPVLSQDIWTGAQLQIREMKKTSREDGQRFVTLAMHASQGATEAFQLSHVAVQMVAEGVLSEGATGRHVKTLHNILIDGRETLQLDTVLCLVNTALLSHDGTYTRAGCVKKTGALTSKTKKALINALESSEDDAGLLDLLCDFRILLKLDEGLTETESSQLCAIVKKWARGQKKSTTVDTSLKRKLQAILEH